MVKKINKHKNAFSLIEVMVFVGIFAVLIKSAFLIGLPEYKHYVLGAEKKFLVDTLLESRSQALATGKSYGVKIWDSGYCTVDSLETILCLSQPYRLPVQMSVVGLSQGVFLGQGLFLTTELNASSTIVKINYDGQTDEINIDQNGFIDGR